MSSFYLIILYLTSRWAIVLPFLVQLFPVRGKLQTQIRLRLSDPHSQGSLLLVTVPMLPAPPGFGLTTLMASDTKTNAATRINPVSKCFMSFISILLGNCGSLLGERRDRTDFTIHEGPQIFAHLLDSFSQAACWQTRCKIILP